MVALQPLYKGLGKEELEGGEVRKKASPPTPLRVERGVITDFAMVLDVKNNILRSCYDNTTIGLDGAKKQYRSF